MGDVTIIVIDSLTNAPIYGAYCSLLNLGDGSMVEEYTSTTGIAYFLELWPSQYQLHVKKDGYSDYYQTFGLGTYMEIPVPLNVAQYERLGIAVHTYGRKGGITAVLPDVEVRIARRPNFQPMITDKTNSLGYVVFMDIPSGDYDISATKVGYEQEWGFVDVTENLPFVKGIAMYLDIIPYEITVEQTTGGTLAPVPGTYPVIPGNQFEVQVTQVASSYYFDHWEVSGGISISDQTALLQRFTPTDNGRIKACFLKEDPGPLYTVTVLASTGGHTDWDGTHPNIPSGTVKKITAVPDSGYFTKEWTVNGAVRPAEGSNSIEITVDRDYTIKPTFEKGSDPGTSRYLTVEIKGTGTVKVSSGTIVGENRYEYTSSVNVTLTANPVAKAWYVNNVLKKENSPTFTVLMDRSLTVTVEFEGGIDPKLLIAGAATAIGLGMIVAYSAGKRRPSAPAAAPARTRRRKE